MKTSLQKALPLVSFCLLIGPLFCHGSSGKIIHLSYFGKDPLFKRNVDIWLPSDYPKSGTYDVLYMHDGQMLYDSSTTWNHQEWMVDETMERLIQEGSIEPTIVIGIWNGGNSRHADYFPERPYDNLPDSSRNEIRSAKRPEGKSIFQEYEVRSDGYLKFIVNELKPYIDSNYATRSSKSNTFIGGSSMGGLISWYAVCEYPDVFGGAICMSTHWPGIFRTEGNPVPEAFIDYLDARLPKENTSKFYFDRGTVGLDAYYETTQHEVDELFRSKGYDDLHYRSREFKGDDHNESAWSNRLSVPLIFMLGKEH